jgi:hypothetical protein
LRGVDDSMLHRVSGTTLTFTCSQLPNSASSWQPCYFGTQFRGVDGR